MKIELDENKVYFNSGLTKKEIHPFWLRERVDGEEFLDKGLKLLLNGKGQEFVEYYYEYLQKIVDMKIPLKLIFHCTFFIFNIQPI